MSLRSLFRPRRPPPCPHETSKDELVPWSEAGGSFDWWQRVCTQCGAVIAFADVRPGLRPGA